jgi:hypothetical protein
MKKAAFMTGATLAAMTACANPDAPTAPTAAPPPNFGMELAPPGKAGDAPAHVFLVRGVSKAAGKKPGSTANLIYHNGPIMSKGAAVQTIFWGPNWGGGTGPIAGDKISGLRSLYSGLGGSSYFKTNSEYYGPAGTFVNWRTVSYGTSEWYDASSPPSGAPSTSAVLSTVCRAISAHGATPRSDGYYAVYSQGKRGNAGYCAWHSAGSCGGTTVQFAFFFDLDGDSGCDPQSAVSGHSQGLAALANVSGHEISEAITDPHLDAWYDRQGAENSDKCAWTFGSSSVTLANGSKWKIQGNWSNAAYNARSGYDGGGCIQTTN